MWSSWLRVPIAEATEMRATTSSETTVVVQASLAGWYVVAMTRLHPLHMSIFLTVLFQASLTAYSLALVSFVNAFYTFWRKRHYRLFENELDKVPSTPSAHRVQVNASPMISSPMRLFSNGRDATTRGDRSTSSAERDVWELTVWDPHPLSVKLFCFLSPGHVVMYWLFLPTLMTDPRPSVTILMTLVMATILSAQMLLFSSSYIQQSKDTSILHKEVFHEYDTKYVRPRTQPIMRNASTQYAEAMSFRPSTDEKFNTVETFTPDFIRRQTFKVNPNPKYVQHVDPDGTLQADDLLSPRAISRTPLGGLSLKPAVNTPFRDLHTPSRTNFSTPSRPQSTTFRQSTYRTPGTTGDGGSLGAYTHANSPVKKGLTPVYQRLPELKSSIAQTPARGSPLKNQSKTSGSSPAFAAQRHT